jgi:ribonuclease D
MRLNIQEQCSDWGTRPLSPNQIDYAAIDVLVLTKIFDKLYDLLENIARQQKSSDDRNNGDSLNATKAQFSAICRQVHISFPLSGAGLRQTSLMETRMDKTWFLS